MRIFPTKSEEETGDVAHQIAGELFGGEVLALEGELGTGKTSFVRGIAEALEAGDEVRSPTFALLHHYRTRHPTIRHIVHADLYRLLEHDRPEQVLHEIGLDEWLDRDDAIVIIEWPPISLLPLFRNIRHIRFEHAGGDSRIISIL